MCFQPRFCLVSSRTRTHYSFVLLFICRDESGAAVKVCTVACAVFRLAAWLITARHYAARTTAEDSVRPLKTAQEVSTWTRAPVA